MAGFNSAPRLARVPGARLLTGNVWFTSGVHAGANFAAFSVSGLWYAGGIVALAGHPAYPNSIAIMLLMVATGMAYLVLERYKTRRRGSAREAV
ncbi:MAG TPA: hypothetical protein VNH22_14270 [Blastocatellia bacterium]|jgi:hypothetical protein|nr:hypothetical protein [Blastocatellia bacterium]